MIKVKPIVSLVIPAKGKSERIENKNLAKIDGVSLVRIACKKALKCKNVDKVYLDTEDSRIIEECSDLFSEGLDLIKRPISMATNFVGGNELIVYELHSIDYCDILMHHYCTCPLISSETIDMSIKKFIEDGANYDSFLTVEKLKEYYWDKEFSPLNFSPMSLPNSQSLDPIYMETHGVYGIRTESIFKLKTRLGKNPFLIEIPKIESIDIDTIDDLEIARRLYNGN